MKQLRDELFIRITRMVVRHIGRDDRNNAGIIAINRLVEAADDPSKPRGKGLRKAFHACIHYACDDAKRDARERMRTVPLDENVFNKGTNDDHLSIEFNIDFPKIIAREEPRLTTHEINDRMNFIALMRAGATIAEMAKSLRHSPTTIQAWLKKYKPIVEAYLKGQL